MKNIFCTIAVLAALIFAQCFVSTSHADTFTYWTNSSGSAAGFDWENGGSTYGLFGDPVLVGGNTFVFSPSEFEAEALDGESDEVYDTLIFDLIAQDGFAITAIHISEEGDYDIMGGGQINVSGNLSVENLLTSQTESDGLDVTPVMPVTSGSGLWSGSADITGLDCTHLKVILSNDLFAIADAGSAALVWKKTVGAPVSIKMIVPEPATIALLTLGALAFIGRKNK